MQKLLLTMTSLLILQSGPSDAADDVELDEVIVTATRRAVAASDVSAGLTLIDQAAVTQNKLVTDALASEVGVYLQQTTPGQGAVVIRGLKGSGILHLVDGIRLNNAIFRSAPTQYFAFVPVAATEQIEVIRGAPTSLYGSDAVAGVVQLVTRKPRFESEETESRGEFFMGLDSGELGRSLRGTFDIGNRRMAASMSAEYLNTGDRKVGGGERIGPSGYTSRAARLLLLATPDDDSEWSLDMQWLEQPETPRIDELVPGYGQTEPDSSEFFFRPNQRAFVHARYSRADGWLNVDWRADLAWQQITDDRTSRNYLSDVRRLEENRSDLYALTISVSDVSDEGSWIAGAEFYDDRVSSSRDEQDIQSGAIQSVASRFPDGSTVRQMAVYANASHSFGSRNTLNGGLRLSSVDVDLPATGQSVAASINEDNLSGDLGWIFSLDDYWQLTANVGAGFRAPNVFDVGTLGERPGNRFNIPNPDLRAETVTQIDIGVRRNGNHAQLELMLYDLQYTDRITSVSTGAVTADGRDIVQSSNASEASIRGAEIGATWQASESFQLRAILNYTWGEQQIISDAKEPADRIPPLSGNFTATWSASDNWQLQGWVRYSGQQDRLSERDIRDPRINPVGTAGWGIVGVESAWSIDSIWQITAGFDNLLDKNYRVHGSGMDAVGRTAFLTLRGVW